MNLNMIKFIAYARASKECQKHLGYPLTVIEIVQLQHHQQKYGIKAPDLSSILKAVKDYMVQLYPYYRREVILGMIDKLKSSPSKPLPLP